MPLEFIFAGFSRDTSAHGKIRPLPQLGAGAWAVLSIWVALDGARIYRLAESPSDPLGPDGLGLPVLGLVNVITAFLFLILTG